MILLHLKLLRREMLKVKVKQESLMKFWHQVNMKMKSTSVSLDGQWVLCHTD